MLKKGLIASTLLFSHLALAGGGAGNGATESTQMMNNGELIASTAKQAQMVAGQIRDYTQQVNQYVTMVQNLKNLPVAVIASTLRPYKDTLRDLGQVYRAVDDVYRAGTQASATMMRRRAEMANMSLDPSEYLRMETLLAAERGGQYRAQYERDLAALKKLEERTKTLAGMDKQVESISGNVEGLQTLAQQNQMLAGEMIELNQQIREQSASKAAEKEQEQLLLEEQKRREAELLELKKRSTEATLKSINDGTQYNVEQRRKEQFSKY